MPTRTLSSFRIDRVYTMVSKVIFFNLIFRFMLEGYLEFAIDSLLQQSSVRGQIGANFVVDMEQQYEEVFFPFRYLSVDHNNPVSHHHLNPSEEILQPA